MSNAEPIYVTAKELAEIVGRTPARIHQLVAAGEIPKAGRSKFDLKETLAAYCRFMDAEADKNTAARGMNEAQRARAEYQAVLTEEKRGSLISRAAVDAVLTEAMMKAVNVFLGLPKRFTRDKDLLSRLEVEVDDSIGRFKQALSDAAGEIDGL